MRALGPVATLALALFAGCIISALSTWLLKRYIDHAERESEGRVIPGRFPRGRA